MAKGQSTFRQLGKIDGRKYYQVKGVDGIVSQSINQGMSNRVKNDAAYANTRLNNAEFGGAGSTAGAITRALSQKWRYLLVPFATGKIAKDVRAIMMQDATGKWGQRGLTGTAWQGALAEKISAYSKNAIEDYQNMSVHASFSSSSGISTIISTPDTIQNEKLEALGCVGFRAVLLAGVINTSVYDAVSGKYAPALCDLEVVSDTKIPFGDENGAQGFRSDIKVTAQVANKMYCGVAVLLPYKTINGEDYIMQEHCSFKLVAAPDVA